MEFYTPTYSLQHFSVAIEVISFKGNVSTFP